MHRALASLWRRVYSQLKLSDQQQARMPLILLAAMLMPMIDSCLKMCGLTCADIDPVSYTHLFWSM